MRRHPLPLLFTAALSVLSGSALTAEAAVEPEPSPAAADTIENITVTGQRPEVVRQLLEDFIIKIGDPVSSNRGYARWQSRLCVGVYNLPDAKTAQYLADKITLVALETGLKTGGPGCMPNLHIVFSPDARALATRMVESTPLMFQPYGGTEGTTQGMAALARFKSSEAPVRWWQVTMIVDEFGYPAITLPDGTGGATTRGYVSRLKASTADALWGGLIIVDATKLGAAKWPQLADYLAMVSLAQVDPDSVPGQDSILSLFNSSTPPPGLTELDLAYLRALYDMNTMMTPYAQRGIFSGQMVRELEALKAE
jgi:hypothetical protein